MKVVLIVALLLAQFEPRTPLKPAETLLEPAILKTIAAAPLDLETEAPLSIPGTEARAGVIAVVAPAARAAAAGAAIKKLNGLIESNQLARPQRTIRFLLTPAGPPPPDTKAAIFVVDGTDPALQVIRGPWSTASLADEVVELFARHTTGGIETLVYRDVGQPQWDAFGVPSTTIITNDEKDRFTQAAFVAAASAYFLATLPNAGAEALLSHLTVGAHARLAEDGRRAVAQMGNQQRAGADVLIMFGQAIEREQRRMRSVETYMPAPVDPMLRSRIAEMETGITSVWTSIGITSAPFVAPADRIRGRGGEDRRVPSRITAGPFIKIELPTAFLKFANVDEVIYELGNFVDGKRSISDIRDAVSAEFAPISLPVVVEYFERLAKAKAISLRALEK